jgi:hypothetical protein
MFRLRTVRSLFRRSGLRHRPSCVPRLLVLEDRTVPSTLTVMTNADSGDGSLRATIAAAQSGDQIVFDNSLQGQTITLASQLTITKSLDIEGPGADQLAVSGNHASRIFDISGGVMVTIAGLTMTDGLVVQVGAAAQGGAIRNVGSTLTVADAVLSDNEARGVGAPGRDGAIESSSGASLIVMNSQFLDNLAHAISTGSTAGGRWHGRGHRQRVGCDAHRQALRVQLQPGHRRRRHRCRRHQLPTGLQRY